MDEGYSNGDITDWVNRALADLTPIAKKQAKQTYTVTSANTYTLPTNYFDFAYITSGQERYDILPEGDFSNVGIKIWGDEFEFQLAPGLTSFTLFYYRKLSPLSTTNMQGVPEIDDQYHDLFIYYARGQMQYTEEDYDDRYDSLQKYQQRKEEFAQYMQKRQRKVRTVEKVVW